MAYQDPSRSDMNSGDGGSISAPTVDSLYRAHAVAVRRHVERHFGSGPPDPEDAVQAAFMKFSAVADRSTILQPLAFLKRCAYNFVIDFHRDQKKSHEHAGQVYDLSETSDDFDAERVLLGKQRAAIIEAAIDNMDERRREILIMSRIHGLTAQEISRRLNCSPTLVKVRLAEAVALCTRALRKAENP